jgi:hypothetical protein
MIANLRFKEGDEAMTNKGLRVEIYKVDVKDWFLPYKCHEYDEQGKYIEDNWYMDEQLIPVV